MLMAKVTSLHLCALSIEYFFKFLNTRLLAYRFIFDNRTIFFNKKGAAKAS